MGRTASKKGRRVKLPPRTPRNTPPWLPFYAAYLLAEPRLIAAVERPVARKLFDAMEQRFPRFAEKMASLRPPPKPRKKKEATEHMGHEAAAEDEEDMDVAQEAQEGGDEEEEEDSARDDAADAETLGSRDTESGDEREQRQQQQEKEEEEPRTDEMEDVEEAEEQEEPDNDNDAGEIKQKVIPDAIADDGCVIDDAAAGLAQETPSPSATVTRRRSRALLRQTKELYAAFMREARQAAVDADSPLARTVRDLYALARQALLSGGGEESPVSAA